MSERERGPVPPTMAELRENLFKPPGVSEQEWRAAGTVYDIIEEMHGQPKDCQVGPRGVRLAEHFTVNPFPDEPGKIGDLVYPVVVHYALANDRLTVQTGVKNEKRIQPSRVMILLHPLIGASAGNKQQAEIDRIKGIIQTAASAAVTWKELNSQPSKR